MDWRSDMLALVEAYCAATGLSETRVASLVGGTGIFFRRIRRGGDCSATKYQGALRWFAQRWPEAAEWPNGILRPEAQGAARPPGVPFLGRPASERPIGVPQQPDISLRGGHAKAKPSEVM